MKKTGKTKKTHVRLRTIVFSAVIVALLAAVVTLVGVNASSSTVSGSDAVSEIPEAVSETDVELQVSEDIDLPVQIVFNGLDKLIGERIFFTLCATEYDEWKPIYMDFGDGQMVLINEEKNTTTVWSNFFDFDEDKEYYFTHCDGTIIGKTMKVYTEYDNLYLQANDSYNDMVYNLSGSTGIKYFQAAWWDCESKIEIDLTNTSVRYFDMPWSEQKMPDVLKLPAALEGLYISGKTPGEIAKLNVNSLTGLKELYLFSNGLTSLDISNLRSLKKLDLDGNKLDFTTFKLWDGWQNDISDYYIGCQAWEQDKDWITVGQQIDLSKYNSVNGVASTYRWHYPIGGSDYDEETGEEYTWVSYESFDPATAENGVFTLGSDVEGMLVGCYIRNDEFPSMTIHTTGMVVLPNNGCSHDRTKLINKKSPTCGEDGSMGDWFCEDCQTVVRKGEVIPATNQHVKNKLIKKVAPTCQDEGYSVYTCKVCKHEFETDLVPTTVHSFKNYVSNNDGTCTANGTKTAECEYGCGATNTVEDYASKKEHTYGEWVDSEDCEHHYHDCTYCGHREEEDHDVGEGYCSLCGGWSEYSYFDFEEAMVVNNKLTLEVGQTIELVSNFYHCWEPEMVSSKESVVEILEEGRIRALAPGKSVITIPGNLVADKKVTVTVVKPAASQTQSVTLNQNTMTLYMTNDKPNPTGKLTAKIVGSATGKLWYSEYAPICTVDQSGKVTAKGLGEVNIYCRTANGITSAPCEVVVKDLRIYSRGEDEGCGDFAPQSTIYVNEGSKVILDIPFDVDFKLSNTKIASLQENYIIGLTKGSGKVTATAMIDGKKITTTCKLVVTKPAEGVKLNKTELSLYKGQKSSLKASLIGKGANEPVTWTVANSKIAYIDQKGNVVGNGQGKTVVTATTLSGKTASAVITVTDKAQSLKFTKTTNALLVGGDEGEFTVAITAPLDCKDTITWSTSNKSVVAISKVSSDGRSISIKSGKKGTATITAKSGSGKKITYKVTSVNEAATSVKMNKSEADIYVGKTVSLSCKVLAPKGCNDVPTWTSSDESIATVDLNGKVTGISCGKVTITATYFGGMRSTSTVYVRSKATAIVLDRTDVELILGNNAVVNVSSMAPEGCYDSVKWTSSSKNLTVTPVSDGRKAILRATKKGKYTVTAKTGSGKSAKVIVNVVEGTPAESIKLTLWGSEMDQDYLKEVCAEFEAQYVISHPEVSSVQVEVQMVGEDFSATKALKDIEAAADVFGVPSDLTYQLVNNNAIMAMPADVTNDIVDLMGQNTANMASYQGKCYGYPYQHNTSSVLYYNKNYYTEDDVKSLNSMLGKNANGYDFAHNSGAYFSTNWYFTTGAELFTNGNANVCTMDSAACVEALKFVQQNSEDIALLFDDDAFAMLKEGTLGSFVTGWWNVEKLKSALGSKLGVAPLPKVTINGTDYQMKCFGAVKYYAVNANTKYPEASIELSKFITNEENQLKRVRYYRNLGSYGFFPTSVSLINSSTPEIDDITCAYLKQSEYTVAQEGIIPGEWWGDAEMFFRDVYSGRIESDDIQSTITELVTVWKSYAANAA